jgi:hypothetical protein
MNGTRSEAEANHLFRPKPRALARRAASFPGACGVPQFSVTTSDKDSIIKNKNSDSVSSL